MGQERSKFTSRSTVTSEVQEEEAEREGTAELTFVRRPPCPAVVGYRLLPWSLV